jgi:hypothetical protein
VVLGGDARLVAKATDNPGAYTLFVEVKPAPSTGFGTATGS